MRVRSVSTLLLIIAILLVLAVGTNIFVDGIDHPLSFFASIVATTLIAGISATLIIEKIDAKVFASTNRRY